MLEFISIYWPSLIIVLAFFIYFIFLIINKKWDKLRAEVYIMMLLAEKSITGTAQGRNRFNNVLVQAYSMLPGWFRFFIPMDAFKEKLQQWYNELKDIVDNGKADSSLNEVFMVSSANKE